MRVTFPASAGLADLRHYDRSRLRGDLLGGLTVTAYAVPQVMAYATLAGLPPASGLWVLALTLVVYFFLGSSRLLSCGPESSTALLTAAILAPLAGGDPVRYAMLAGLLALLCGVFAIIAWALRLGFIGDLLSKPVLLGYMAGVAVIMIVSQLGKVTGVDVAGDSIVHALESFAQNMGDISWPTVVVGLGVAVLLLLLTPRFPRLPMPLLIVLLATLVTSLLDLQSQGVVTVGTLDTAAPAIGFGGLDAAGIGLLALPALGVFIVGYTDNLATARVFAARTGDHVNANRELLALGACNVGAAALQGWPVSSAASRTALGYASGARTQVSSLFTTAGIVIVVVAFTGVLAQFPLAALGGLVIYAATRLVDVPGLQRLWSFRKREFALAAAAFVGVLLFDILYGILAAVILSIVEILIRVARPHSAVLGQAPGVAGWHDVDDYAGSTQVPGLLVYRYDSPLFFANAEDFARKLRAAVDGQSPLPKWVLLNMEANAEVDITALDSLQRAVEHFQREGVIVALARVKHDVLLDLRRHGVLAVIGEDRVFPTMPTAVQAYEDWVQAED